MFTDFLVCLRVAVLSSLRLIQSRNDIESIIKHAEAVIMVLFWGAIIWLVISLVNASTKKSEETSESALTILKKRYARGEITREQYLEMEKQLSV